MFGLTVAALLSLVAVAHALPTGSPLCLINGETAGNIANAMGANKQKIDCKITADATSYTLGGSVTVSWACSGVDNLQGLLAYAESGTDPNKKVGAFTLIDGLKSNKANCGDTLEQDNSAVTHSAPGKFSPNGSITYTAPSTDQGTLTLKFVVVKKLDAGGFGWGVFPDAIKLTSPGGASGTSGAEATAVADAFSCQCPSLGTVSVIKKCTPKTAATTKVFFTKTKKVDVTMTMTKTKTKMATETVRVTGTCPGTVAGGEETPTSTGGGYGYGNGYGSVAGGESTPTTTSGYGSYGAYSVNEDEADEEAEADEEDDDEEDS